ISPSPQSIFEVRRESADHWLNAADMETVLIPSRQAVADLASQFGFQTVPLALNMGDLTGLGEYREGRRLAFISSKGPSLAGLSSEPVHSRSSTSARRLVRRLRNRAKQLGA